MPSVDSIRAKADYQIFDIAQDGTVGHVGERMAKKLRALDEVLPGDLSGKSVLDIGCDFGFWSFLAAERGAKRVLGLDRSRQVKDVGWLDLPSLNNETEKAIDRKICRFVNYEAGVQFHDFGGFDLVLCMSLYHHIYNNVGGDHNPIWYWLWRQCNGSLIWENPVSTVDPVVRADVHEGFHDGYTPDKIRRAAERYFDVSYVGPAMHEPSREVWLCTPKERVVDDYEGVHKSGAGGASKAFLWENGRRINEIAHVLGNAPVPGSMNIHLNKPFDWDKDYYRTLILDVVDRRIGLSGQWKLRPCRFYPVSVNGFGGYAMRFEGEKYPLSFIEVISDRLLKDKVWGIMDIRHGNRKLQ